MYHVTNGYMTIVSSISGVHDNVLFRAGRPVDKIKVLLLTCYVIKRIQNHCSCDGQHNTSYIG